MKVLFAGGGTGGHINPALAIASIIQSHQPDAEFCCRNAEWDGGKVSTTVWVSARNH